MPTVERDLRFQFKITPITVPEGRPQDRGPWVGTWVPPDERQLYTRDDTNSTGWHEWSSGGIQRLPYQTGTLSRICSIFFNDERGCFMVCEADCSETDLAITDGVEPWRGIGFMHRRESNDRLLSAVSFSPAENHRLAARGHPNWLPQLIPAYYDGSETYRVRYTDLAGELSILLGAAAFTCPPEKDDIIQTIRRNFRLPRWIPHNLCRQPPGPERQGYIIKVTASPGVDLEGFQDGRYGPLILGE